MVDIKNRKADRWGFVPREPLRSTGLGALFYGIMADRVSFFIDGYNLYHSIVKGKLPNSYKWLDLYRLCNEFVGHDQELCEIYYFSALAKWKPESCRRHQIYLKALESLNINIELGQFKEIPKVVRLNDFNRVTLRYITHEEKQSDVHLGAMLVKLAYEDKYDKGCIITADGDLVPAIKIVTNPPISKNIKIIFPYGYHSKELSRLERRGAKEILKIHLERSLLPEEVNLRSGRTIECPPEWRI